MIIEDTVIEGLWRKTVEKCKEKTIENMLLHGVFDITEIDTAFIQLHKDSAKKWQEKEKPKELIINHGAYINKGKSDLCGIDFILNELKNKPCGNRACYSLINMEDIVGSGDTAIPSFMVLQFSFSQDDNNKLLVSAYFRALEVKAFLPINLSEICLNVKKVKEIFPNITKFELNMFVFRAQYIEEFNCLTHSKLDTLTAAEMVYQLMTDKKLIVDTLKDKQRKTESIITITGMKNLLESIDIVQDLKYKDDIRLKINSILDLMESIKKMRENTSLQHQIEKETIEVKEELKKLIQIMER